MLQLPLVAILAAVLLPQAAPIDVGVNSGGDFGFDWDGNHDDGTSMAETKSVEFHYIAVPPTPVIPGTGDGHFTVTFPFEAVIGENVIPMKTALAGVPGGVWDLNVRLMGVGGGFSTYSKPLLRVRIKNPAPPTNVRVVGNS